jgi:hypothetical protein
MRLEERGVGWEGQKEGGHGTAVGKEVNAKNFRKRDDDAESVAGQQQHFDRGCDVGRFSAETE